MYSGKVLEHSLSTASLRVTFAGPLASAVTKRDTGHHNIGAYDLRVLDRIFFTRTSCPAGAKQKSAECRCMFRHCCANGRASLSVPRRKRIGSDRVIFSRTSSLLLSISPYTFFATYSIDRWRRPKGDSLETELCCGCHYNTMCSGYSNSAPTHRLLTKQPVHRHSLSLDPLQEAPTPSWLHPSEPRETTGPKYHRRCCPGGGDASQVHRSYPYVWKIFLGWIERHDKHCYERKSARVKNLHDSLDPLVRGDCAKGAEMRHNLGNFGGEWYSVRAGRLLTRDYYDYVQIEAHVRLRHNEVCQD